MKSKQKIKKKFSVNNHALCRALGMEIKGPEWYEFEAEVSQITGGWGLVNKSPFIFEWRSAAGKKGGKITANIKANDPTYSDRQSAATLKSWIDAHQRRKEHSNKMKQTWQSGKITAEMSRKNGRHGLTGKKNPVSKPIEYKGITYYGWRELQEATGVTKDLYNAHYLRGYDPESRIGKNGPIKGDQQLQPLARRV